MDEFEPIDRVYFHGTWREFMPIVAVNLLLTIVTLGIYRFWGATRERRYLWSRTVLIDEELEWMGNGRELLIGFLLAALLLGGPLLLWNFGIQALLLRDMTVAAIILGAAALLFLNFMIVSRASAHFGIGLAALIGAASGADQTATACATACPMCGNGWPITLRSALPFRGR